MKCPKHAVYKPATAVQEKPPARAQQQKCIQCKIINYTEKTQGYAMDACNRLSALITALLIGLRVQSSSRARGGTLHARVLALTLPA